MKAMILAAGMGTRLLPFTLSLPKPLFPISGRPVLEHIIDHIYRAGFESIIINTHHLYQQIENFIRLLKHPIPIEIRYEPKIRGTGGGIKNISDWMDEDPLLIVNGDIVFNIDLKSVYDSHRSREGMATLVLCDDPDFNSVGVNKTGMISAIGDQPDPDNLNLTWLTFTGIHVIEPGVLQFIPDDDFSSIIPVYRHLIGCGKSIHAYVLTNSEYWKDIGTPQSYQQAALDQLSAEAFGKAYPGLRIDLGKPTCLHLEGDGSDRSWHRLFHEKTTLVAANHGIRVYPGISEIDSFVKIGLHLNYHGVPVPKIHAFDIFSGWVILEDLGNTTLQKVYLGHPGHDSSIQLYQQVILHLIKFNIRGFSGFDPAWAYQSRAYDTSLILEKECRYFFDSFINDLSGLNLGVEEYMDEFAQLAEAALKFPYTGLMHRDFQSRNIMIKEGNPYFIDFQGARIGPLQYDLASLLIDPYVELPAKVQDQLLDFCVQALPKRPEFNEEDFRYSYLFCSISRNMQILGAFSYLSRIKNKIYFIQYIPGAVRSLIRLLSQTEASSFPKIKALLARIEALSIPSIQSHL
jgi:aminoglycoside/choline kinase family phosphotransferase/choline kinase